MPYTDRALPFTGSIDLTIGTSFEAAEQAAGKAGTKRRNVLALLSHHPDGLTDTEMQGLLHMDGNTQRPRRIELHRAKLIYASGDRHVDGTRHVVWSVTALGKLVARSDP